MFIGNNKLQLNPATVMLALQEWLERQVPKRAPKVTEIKWDANVGVLIVSLSGEDGKATKA